MNVLSSRNNPIVKNAKLLSSKKGREQSGRYLIEGKKLIEEAMSSGVKLRDVYISESVQPFPLPSETNIYYVTEDIMKAICDTVTPQGIAAVIDIPIKTEPDFCNFNGLIVALDGLSDPGNIGTIIRTADAAGASCVLMSSNCAELYSPKTIRSTMGSIYHIPVFHGLELEYTLNRAKTAGFKVLGSALNGNGFYDYVPSSRKNIIIIGNEAHGISHSSQAISDVLLTLPMRGRAESLNASVAAGVMIYELTRKTSLL